MSRRAHTRRREQRARAYRALLHLLPSDFRRGFGADMLQLFLDRCADIEGQSGALARLWVAAVWDVVSSAAVERTGGFVRVVKDVWAGLSAGGWRQDLWFAGRVLRRKPGFSLAAVVTLALGIGANVSIFSVVNGVLMTPLPYPQPESIVAFWGVNEQRGTRSRGVSQPDVQDWRGETSTFAHVAGYGSDRRTLTGYGRPEVVAGAQTTGDFMAVFGVTPLLGRDLTPADDVPDGPRVVVVSHAFWSDRMGRNPSALGATITLDGETWQVVGVAPEGFDVPEGADFWLPFSNDPADCGRGCRIMAALGRLEEGVSLQNAQARMETVSARLAQAYPDSHRDLRTELQRYADVRVADVRVGLWVLFGAVAMVLLIACANVANLLLVRASARRGEVALRSTLGASGLRLARQLLTESLLLAFLGGAGGALMAWWGTSLLAGLSPGTLPRGADVSMDGTVLLYAVIAVLGVTALFGALPAIHLSRSSPAASLNGSRGAPGGRGSGLLRSSLLCGEVALSMMLLLGAGLLLRTIGQMRDVDLGFVVEDVERFRISLPDARYEDGAAAARFFESLETELGALAGVERVGIAFGAPLASGSISTDIEFLEREPVPPADRPAVAVRPTSPGYIEAAGIPLVEGRWFGAEDRRDAGPVVVLSRSAARRFYGDADPLGKRVRLSISWGFDDEPARTVVGVVGDVRTRGITEEDRPAAYVPNAQFGAGVGVVTLKLRPWVETALPAARATVRALDAGLAITNEETMSQAVDSEFSAATLYSMLLSAFSTLALVLAAVGLYGAVAYGVSRRTREIGIRMALGARAREVTVMVILQGVTPALLGIGLGLGGSWVGGRALSAYLYGVQPTDPRTLTAATLVLLAVVTAATLLPALRAARIPPASALRSE